MKFNEILQKLGDSARCNSLGNYPEVNPEITGVAPIDAATNGTFSYIEGDKFAPFVSTTDASALILPMQPELQTQASARGMAWIASEEPRLLFAQVISLLYQPWRPNPGIDPTAKIDPSAQIGADVYIGAFVSIAHGVTIGQGVQIYPNVVIYPQVSIGQRTILHANCTIHERTSIGSNCVIHSGAVIGAEGFGFVPSPTGWVKMEQSGCTILEDGVEVGCNSTIDRPAVGETRIGANTKIDNLVQVGHGCHIGKNCALAAHVGLAGGVKIEDNVILAGQVGVANRVKIGAGAIATAKSGIHSDVPPGAIVSGYPAIANKIWLKTVAISNRLPEIYQAFKQLKRKFGDRT